MFLSAFIQFSSSLWINRVLINWNFRWTGRRHAKTMQITLKGSPFCHQPLVSVTVRDCLSFPSLLLTKTTNKLQTEMSTEKLVYEDLRFMHLAPFCSSANSPNVQHVTKPWGTRQKRKCNLFRKFTQQILAGIYRMHDTVLDAMGYEVSNSHNIQVLQCLWQLLKVADTRHLGEELT